MALREFASLEELAGFVGQESASDWVTVEQDRINAFAEATEDRQWIHVDVERARRDSPHHATIAHGFLTLSLLSHLMSQAVRVTGGIRMGINYGLNRVRFPAPVPAGSRLRGRFKLVSLTEVQGAREALWSATIEREGASKPCCVAEWLVRYYV